MGNKHVTEGFRTPNVCVTAAEADWLYEAARILKGGKASDDVRRKAATYVAKVAREASTEGST